jgi:hypothetical protein
MVCFLEITTIRDFWFTDFFLEIFKIHRLVWIFLWIFGCFECVSTMFCIKLLLILNLKSLFYQRPPSETFLYHRTVSPPPPEKKEIHWLGPMNLKIYSQERNSRRQLTKSRDFHQNYLCDFHLRKTWLSKTDISSLQYNMK